MQDGGTGGLGGRCGPQGIEHGRHLFVFILGRSSDGSYAVDDGDGTHVMPVTIRLSLVAVPLLSLLPSKGDIPARSTFLSAKQRKAERRIAEAQVKPRIPVKAYARKDVRVGDVVRVVGKLDEWQRRKAGGEVEWVRQVVVEEGSGGRVGKLNIAILRVWLMGRRSGCGEGVSASGGGDATTSGGILQAVCYDSAYSFGVAGFIPGEIVSTRQHLPDERGSE